jgi:hypothetical protein
MGASNSALSNGEITYRIEKRGQRPGGQQRRLSA